MAINPIDLLRERVTPQIIQPDPITDASQHQFNSKSALLDQFYPILLGIFAYQPHAFDFALEHPNALFADIFPQQATSASFHQLLEEFSRHHNLPVETIAPLLDQATPLSAQALQADIAPANVVDYLQTYLPIIVSSIPAWSIAVLGSLGLAGLFKPEADIPAVAPVSDIETAHHMPVETGAKTFRDQLPWWLGLAALLLLALLLLRACQRDEVPPPVTTTTTTTTSTTSSSGYPASINLTVGSSNNLLACNASVGDGALNSLIGTAINQVFGTQYSCNSLVNPAYSATLPGQDKMVTILNLVKPYPNASLSWSGNQLVINAPDTATINRLVDQIKGIAPELGVAAISPLDVDQSVNSSIEASRSALTNLSSPASAEDVARALNLQIINFASDSAVIPDANKAILDIAATLMKQSPEIVLMIEGYTDSTGDAVYNKRLSEQRAHAVVDYLVSQGVAANQLSAMGYGQENPVADNVTEQGKFHNRRIEFKVVNTQTGNTEQVDETTAVTTTAEQASR
ncbi:OmpA family protein [Alkanindiges illinoisensis]|uniref:OmpA family protein n=1 Tax=Alkanindiges illinoisensis TaxID=197183 RepID=A0A4Y7XF82_9GAMM|nr:OmpA family protein [Alkanindiges illinoisensis]TEU29336.1 OmpA family protein [Alkanindiges illinoisensis]